MTRFGTTLTLLVGASLGLAGCSNSIDDGTPGDDDNNKPDPNETIGGDGTSFDHPNDGPSVWDLLDRLTKQGPPSFTSKMHACPKILYSTLGTVLTSLGVNINNATAGSAGAIYKASAASLGGPSYANRIRESLSVTTSGASSEFDIFAAAAPEVIAALPNLERCKVNNVAPLLFDAAGCHAEGITCLIGVPATPGHVEICNLTLSRASDKPNGPIGQRLAVAALLAAAFTCE